MRGIGGAGVEPASSAAAIWQDLQKGAQYSLESTFIPKVLQPIADYLAEIDGIKKLHSDHGKKVGCLSAILSFAHLVQCVI